MNDKKREDKPSTPLFDPEKKILDYTLPIDHSRLLQYLEHFKERYPFLGIQSLGNSLLGRSIPVISLGEGKKTMVYLGSARGVDWLSCILLLRFINEYAEAYRTGRHIYNTYLPYLFHSRRILIVPMPNPDGVDYCLNGVKNDNPLYMRLLSQCTSPADFSLWEGNARGVDLTHNYNARFFEYRATQKQAPRNGCLCAETPESEPEVAYLCNYLRFYREEIGAVIQLLPTGDLISCYEGTDSAPRSASLGRILSRLSGSTLSAVQGQQSDATLLPWCGQHLKTPAYTLACGRGKSAASLKYYFCLYASIRQLLFEAPQLI